MKTLIIDYGRYNTSFYIEDSDNLTLKKSRRFDYNSMEIVHNSIDIIRRNTDIKTVKIDKSGFGSAIIIELSKELRNQGLLDIEVLGYRMMAM